VGIEEELHSIDSIDNYLSIVDASKFLSKCTKTIRSYISDGILRARRFKGQGRTYWIKRDDLNALKEMGDERLHTSDIWNFLRTIKLRLYSIERKLDFLMRVSGLDISSLRDAKTDVLIAAYDEVCELLDANAQDIPYTDMRKWVGLILQFTELEYERLVSPTMDTQPWKPFHCLCIHLMNTLRRKKGFANHQEMQETYRLLDKARKQISYSALIFEESRAGKLGTQQVAKIADFGFTEDSLDRYISSEAQKSGIH
jgi:hypothetical protein